MTAPDPSLAAVRERMVDEATPRPWSWWTSCSWRRLSSDVRGHDQDGGVLCPIIAPDGHPDLSIRQADMDFLIRAVNAHDDLVAALTIARRYVKSAHGAADALDAAGEPDLAARVAERIHQLGGDCGLVELIGEIEKLERAGR